MPPGFERPICTAKDIPIIQPCQDKRIGLASEMDRLGRSNIHAYEPEVIPNKAAVTSGPLFIPKPKFNDKMFDGLRDEDREQTEYLDEGNL